MDPDILRLLLLILLALLGGVLRFGNLPPSPGYGLGLPWTFADPDIWRRSNHRLGEMLLLWALWLGFRMTVGLSGDWLPTLVAPLVIVVTLALSYPARLYLNKYHTLRVERSQEEQDRPIPRRGGWPVLLLRECLPLAAILVPILVIREAMPDLPDRLPVRWDVGGGPTDVRWRDEALDLLRHQTMLVYLMLSLLEGGYLLWKWARGTHGDIALRMLTRSHWLYFLFKLGWTALFAGMNLGFVAHARDGSSLVPYLAPGLTALTVLGVLAAVELRRGSYTPPPDGRPR